MSKQDTFAWFIERSDDRKEWSLGVCAYVSRREAERDRDLMKRLGYWKFFRIVKFVRAES